MKLGTLARSRPLRPLWWNIVCGLGALSFGCRDQSSSSDAPNAEVETTSATIPSDGTASTRELHEPDPLFDLEPGSHVELRAKYDASALSVAYQRAEDSLGRGRWHGRAHVSISPALAGLSHISLDPPPPLGESIEDVLVFANDAPTTMKKPEMGECETVTKTSAKDPIRTLSFVAAEPKKGGGRCDPSAVGGAVQRKHGRDGFEATIDAKYKTDKGLIPIKLHVVLDAK